MFGEAGMRVSASGIFTRMPSILFGPVWGGLVSGINDVMNHLLRPIGAYLPQLTATAAIAGIICGALWLLLRNCNATVVQIIMLGASCAAIAFGIASVIALGSAGLTTGLFSATPYFFAHEYATDISSWISRWVVERCLVSQNPDDMLVTMVRTFTIAPIVAGLMGGLLCITDFAMSSFLRRDDYNYKSIMPLLIAMLVAAWVQNSINTVVFRNTIFQESWGLLPFSVVWLPRILQTTIVNIVYVYFVAVLLGVVRQLKWMRPYLR